MHFVSVINAVVRIAQSLFSKDKKSVFQLFVCKRRASVFWKKDGFI